ncbi:DUF6783 domain-containing protein [Robinsoniella sp. RHS]|uniref:DUF6783 domain-containing protein n=1 Tax=Robinsoniella sp. RHS TaxID=1504536 RepID=UPI0037533CAC
MRNASGFRSECPRAAKKRSGKVRKCQFCGKPSKRLPWSAPFSFCTLPTSTKRHSSAKPQYIKPAGSLNFIRVKFPTKCDAQLPESYFKTSSSIFLLFLV